MSSLAYLVRPMSFVLVIVLGYALKRAGFLRKEDQPVLSRIMINITLPCAIIQGFSSFERDSRLFWIVGIGFICAFLPMLLMYLTTRGVDTRLRAYRMINIGGYNVGCFSLPLISAFFGSQGVVAACMFDTGNAVMMTGGSYAMTSTLLKTGGGHRESIGDILLKFLKSTPFDTYMLLFALTALNIPIPQLAFDLTQPAGSANGFIAMLIIGLMFEPAGDRQMLGETMREMACRYAFAAISAAACYFLTPFDPVVRKTLAVLCFAPLSSLAPIYTQRCHSDTALAGFTNSVSIAISLVCMMALSMFFVM
ncbi:MAG: AEC family transporter [Clostridia bacterium]|nr:AEC family transporter [Clostridia bacterium]